MVSTREEYILETAIMEFMNKAGETVQREIVVVPDSDLPELTDPKTEAYEQAHAEQMHYQAFKGSVCRLWSKLHGNYFKNAVAWIEDNILVDMDSKQIKSLRFRVEKRDGDILTETYPAGDDTMLSWTDVLKVKAHSEAGFSMAQLVKTSRTRTTKKPVKINKFYAE